MGQSRTAVSSNLKRTCNSKRSGLSLALRSCPPYTSLTALAAFCPVGESDMTIRQRGKEGICESQFWIDGEFHQFTFNGKKGMPLITSKRQAKEHENDLKQQIRAGTFLKDSDLKNFAKFFNEIYLDYS